ncbi:MFS transporter [Acidimangrovimonas sediminis]|uniref:MFS transporter n=1 Tax=Acidimangrovimonas sediminis TaxID=2056283 RepID=UPI000C80D645|nr:MFS transporter [Acidimangrovimonas sediminis]
MASATDMAGQAGEGARGWQEPLETRRKSAIKGAFFSEYIDMFDIYLPVVALAPVMFVFQPQNLSAAAQTVLASLVFITTLLGRPIGALIFGMVADKVGRRAASIYSVSGFGVVTLLIALLPGYETLGLTSYILLVLLRFVDGIFLGGGYTGAMPLAIEYSKKSQRGFVGGLILAGFPAAYVSINIITALMFWLAPLDGPGSAYATWGWRVPFVFGAILAGVLALYYTHKVSESEVWKQKEGEIEEAEKLPLSSLLKGQSGRNLLQVLILMTGFWLTQNIITIYLPTGMLVHTLHLSGFELTTTLMITYVVLFFSYIGSGMLGQVIGRRTFFAIAGPLIATVGAYLFYLLGHSPEMSFAARTFLVVVLAVLVTSPWGVIVTYINERFVTDVRATGFGIGFSLSVVLPSFYAFYMDGLSAFMPLALTPVVLLVIGGLIGMTGALMGPETKDVDFGLEE